MAQANSNTRAVPAAALGSEKPLWNQGFLRAGPATNRTGASWPVDFLTRSCRCFLQTMVQISQAFRAAAPDSAAKKTVGSNGGANPIKKRT